MDQIWSFRANMNHISVCRVYFRANMYHLSVCGMYLRANMDHISSLWDVFEGQYESYISCRMYMRANMDHISSLWDAFKGQYGSYIKFVGCIWEPIWITYQVCEMHLKANMDHISSLWDVFSLWLELSVCFLILMLNVTVLDIQQCCVFHFHWYPSYTCMELLSFLINWWLLRRFFCFFLIIYSDI